MFNPISKAALASFDAKIEPLLVKMVKASNGRYNYEGLYGALASGEHWLAEIGNFKAAMVLGPVRWNTGLNELEIIGLAGDGIAEWKEAMFGAETLARELNFHRLSIPHGRPGWAKVCAPFGWKERGVILEKDLLNG
jgi:hypothetical protein